MTHENTHTFSKNESNNSQDEPFSWKEIYSFCFDKKHDQVAYVKYRILSPNLLKNRQLQRVRSYYEGVYRLEELEDESLKAYLNMIMNPLPEQKEERKVSRQPSSTGIGKKLIIFEPIFLHFA